MLNKAGDTKFGADRLAGVFSGLRLGLTGPRVAAGVCAGLAVGALAVVAIQQVGNGDQRVETLADQDPLSENDAPAPDDAQSSSFSDDQPEADEGSGGDLAFIETDEPAVLFVDGVESTQAPESTVTPAEEPTVAPAEEPTEEQSDSPTIAALQRGSTTTAPSAGDETSSTDRTATTAAGRRTTLERRTTTTTAERTTTTRSQTTAKPTTSQAPTTRRPTTEAPTTRPPTTRAPTTRPPTTQAPTTRPPTTRAPTTRPPTTQPPTTQAPTTQPPSGGSCASNSEFERIFRDDFNGSSVSNNWNQYNSSGNSNYGLRRPSAISVSGGKLQITAKMVNDKLVSGGMSLKLDQPYGKYVVRVRTDNDPNQALSGVVLTWPQSGVHPRDGENNIYETLVKTPNRNPFFTFIHKPYGSKSDQEFKRHDADGARFQTMTMEWTPSRITIIRDGPGGSSQRDVWTVNETSADLIPDVPHHLAIQLDAWKHSMNGQVRMEVDYVEVHKYCG